MLFDYVWNSADLDQNGHVCFEELRAFLQGPSTLEDEEDSTELTECLAYPNVDCVLALFDVDNEFDGLDYEEAQLAYSFFFPYDTTEDFEAAFDGLDQNEDGLISGEELAAVLGT